MGWIVRCAYQENGGAINGSSSTFAQLRTMLDDTGRYLHPQRAPSMQVVQPNKKTTRIAPTQVETANDSVRRSQNLQPPTPDLMLENQALFSLQANELEAR